MRARADCRAGPDGVGALAGGGADVAGTLCTALVPGFGHGQASGAWRAVLRGRAGFHLRSDHCLGRGDSHREPAGREVTHIDEHRITPENVPVFNYAFDVTPAGLISGIITEKGVLTAPYEASIRQMIGGK